MVDLREVPSLADLASGLPRLWDRLASKLRALAARLDLSQGAPVHTIEGRYWPRDWTEWTLGFHVGSSLLQFDATGDEAFLDLAQRQVRAHMEPSVMHFGVHDHGFTCASTFGTWLQLMHEGSVDDRERAYWTLALKVSRAVQALRWTRLGPGRGYIYSFNGRHSLFLDTSRSLKVSGACTPIEGGAVRRAGQKDNAPGPPSAAC